MFINRTRRSAFLLLVAFFATIPATSRADIVASKVIAGFWHVVVMDSNGNNETVLTQGSHDNLYATPSPDGAWIAFSSFRTGSWQIYVMRVDGSDLRQITSSGNNWHSSWTPDGTKLTFVIVPPGAAKFDIGVMNIDGSGVVNLTNTPDVSEHWPDFNNQGTKIAFSRGAEGPGAVWTMNPDGSGQQQISFDSWDEWAPAWSPDGSRVFYHGLTGGDWDIKSVASTGGNMINHTPWVGTHEHGPFVTANDQLYFTSTIAGAGIYSMPLPSGAYQVVKLGDYTRPRPFLRLGSPSLTLNASSVAGGVQASGTVTFAQTAPTQRLVLMSDNSDYVLMSTYCIVPANQTTGTFNIWTYGVASNTVATIAAEFSGVTRTASLTLTPATLDLLWISPTSVVGGNPSMGNVRLVGKAPAGGAVVALSSSNTAAANHASSVTISYGGSLRQFPISTFGVDTTKSVVVSATYRGATRTASIAVRPAALSALSLATNTVKGGNPVVATVTMTGKTGPSGRTVFLFSNQPKIIVPGSMYVPPQKFSWNFTVLTQSVTSNTVGTITATQGATTRTATLMLTP